MDRTKVKHLLEQMIRAAEHDHKDKVMELDVQFTEWYEKQRIGKYTIYDNIRQDCVFSTEDHLSVFKDVWLTDAKKLYRRI
jgi:hypothetical protein